MTTAPTGKRKYANCTNYSEVIQKLGYVHCPGGCEYAGMKFGVASHSSGWISYWSGTPTIHWEERRLTRRGLRLLLLLAAEKEPGAYASEYHWLALYFRDREVQRLGKRFHIRFPRSWSAYERAKARQSMMNQPPGQIDKEFPEQRQLLRRVDRWAKP